MSKVLRMPGHVRRQREIWRDDLRKLSQEQLIQVLEIRFLNDIDVAARRGKKSAKMPIASDTFSEFSYKEMRVVDAAIKYLVDLVRPAGIRVSKRRKEVVVGPMEVVTTGATAKSSNGKKLKSANLTMIRRLLRDARKRREKMAA